MVPSFHQADLTLDNYWRAIILYGRNVASYKFALAKTLLQHANQQTDILRLEDLAEPFARHICEHLETVDKQATSPTSKFLDACRNYNNGQLSKDDLIDATVRLGFVNVIDAFHIVNQDEVGARFFLDERKTRNKGIRLTDELRELREHYQYRNLPNEVEARWRLVETAWELNLPKHAITVGYDTTTGLLLADPRRYGRKPITGTRDALNGYQKGKCFYCYSNITVQPGADDLADVDHFFPHLLKIQNTIKPIDGVWNLVLACPTCNRGPDGKLARLPEPKYLERLNTRNEDLIDSHHPLRETLIQQTGLTREHRTVFLQHAYNEARSLLIHTWTPEYEQEPTF